MKKKILLLHGWNWKNYTKFCPQGTNPWNNRTQFIEALEKSGFIVLTPSFPGFCGEIEPDSPWSLPDFEQLVEKYYETEQPDAVVGYSFGGAVVCSWKNAFQRFSVPTILISPAITRKYVVKNVGSISRFKKLIPSYVIKFLRDLYLRKVIKNPFYMHGTYFLRETYRNIVTIDLSKVLTEDGNDKTLLVYGKNDTATPPQLVLEKIPENSKLRKNIIIIEDGDHDIANTHPEILVQTIDSFLKNK